MGFRQILSKISLFPKTSVPLTATEYYAHERVNYRFSARINLGFIKIANIIKIKGSHD